jgi:hypothetical protein
LQQALSVAVMWLMLLPQAPTEDRAAAKVLPAGRRGDLLVVVVAVVPCCVLLASTGGCIMHLACCGQQRRTAAATRQVVLVLGAAAALHPALSPPASWLLFLLLQQPLPLPPCTMEVRQVQLYALLHTTGSTKTPCNANKLFDMLQQLLLLYMLL